MSGTRIETVALPPGPPGDDDPGPLPLTVAEPETEARGGLVVLHEARGVTDDVDGVLTALAAEGWLAVAPHLYHRHGLTGVDPDPDEQAASLTGAGVLADCDAAFGWLAGRGTTADRIGVLGFDLGGAVAFVVAASRQVGAAVSVSPTGVGHGAGDLPSLLEAAPSLSCPWLGLFGESDPAAPAEDVEALREAAAGGEVATNVVTYAGVGHRFDTESREDDAEGEVAGDAMARVFDWFDSHLR
ncbi:dienelactone hydrolase family protein [Rhodococcus aerolatus]